ncbi:MAG TPA: DUF2849 domain-containing protein [Sphingobium sp.]
MILATGNDLGSGDVIWWTGEGWSRHVGDAVDVGTDGEAIIEREAAARRVNVAYLVEADAGPNGPLPHHIKERIRASGPTVRTDLAINADIPIVKA